MPDSTPDAPSLPAREVMHYLGQDLGQLHIDMAQMRALLAQKDQVIADLQEELVKKNGG